MDKLRTFLDSLPLSELDQTLAIDATITPTDLDAAREHSGQPSLVSSSNPPLSLSGDVDLSQVSAVAAVWIAALPTLSVAQSADTSQEISTQKIDLEIQELLGEGGMGVVKSAKQCALGRQVAVKMLHDNITGHDKSQSLLREALVMGQLEHPNVIPVYTLGQTAQKPVLVMKRVEGVSWRTLIHKPDHPHWDKLDAHGDVLGFHLQVLIQVARALEFAHSRGIIHRDIKPDNVMIGSYGEVYVLDWGIALHLDERTHQRPTLLGTPAYMAPEMAMGAIQAIDVRTDVYLLGATLYEILTRRTRHQGLNLMATLCAAGQSDPPVFDSTTPLELVRIVNQATAAEPSTRYPDARAFREAVSRYLHHRGSLALSDEASAKAKELFAVLDGTLGPQSQEARSLFAACQFGFLMALRSWAENEDARAGLVACVERMARAEMKCGDVEHAARLLDQCPEGIDPAFRAKVAQALETHRQDRSQLNDLVKMRQDLDISQGHQKRSQFLVLMWVVSTAVTVVVMLTTPHDSQIPWSQMLWLVVVMGGVYGGLLLFGRKRFLTNLINQRLALVMGMFPLGIAAQRLLAWHYGASITEAFAQDMLLEAVLCVVVSFSIYKRLALAAIPFALGVVGAVLMPGRGAFAFGISGGMAIFIFLWALARPRRRGDGGGEQPPADQAAAL